ncbi:hypothetical protein M758_1G200800 [Ceratodon purpureus]|uniref:Cysteine-rich transmembrane CYSTM domain-containing protein n=1 Tax=Ceratodon purpureus TaxID=3225 RepID=A0A8T0JAR4_CERPU|nr:hypothetical protein KC19_1G220000 [Ceratodon purpureus]KAG0630737.1 hypothetical protein M758_1G200800 [Ceratodon purpureus]
MSSKPDRDGPFPQNQQIPQGYPPPGYPYPPQDPFYGAPGAPPPAYGYPPPPGYGYQQQPQGYYGQQPNYQGGIMAPPQQGYYGGQRPQSGGWLQGCLQALCCCCLMDECVDGHGKSGGLKSALKMKHTEEKVIERHSHVSWNDQNMSEVASNSST